MSSEIIDGSLGVCRFGKFTFAYREDSYDRYIIGEIWERGEYFLDRISLEDGDAVIDIGGHIGSFSVKATSLFPGCRVIAFEPVPENFRLLELNLDRNGCTEVVRKNEAVMGRAGEIHIHLDPKNTAGHSAVQEVSPSTVVAKAVTLADAINAQGIDHVGLLKIDCEGSEYEIISATPEEIWSRISNVVFEYHPVKGHAYEELKQFLEARGFALTAHREGYFDGQGTALFQRQ